MKMKKWTGLFGLLLALSMLLAACGNGDSSPSSAPADSTESPASESATLSAPTDFTFDPTTGEYSFNATDERMGYYFIRFYRTENGKEVGEYIASSPRINGGTTGPVSGTLDLSEVSWGSFHVNLSSFAPSGSGYTAPGPLNIAVQYGVGQTLERPEMLAMYSGNQVEFVVDWWTLCDYNFLQYMPNMKFTFYSDPECTAEVFSDTVDLAPLVNTLKQNPPGMIYIWGYSQVEGAGLHLYLPEGYDPNAEPGGMFGGPPKPVYFMNDIYTYTMDPGTYYVTCQALSKDEYTLNSKPSTVLEITLTDGEPTTEFEQAKTELWVDYQQMDMPGANPGQQPDRIDNPMDQGVSGQVIR